MFIAIVGKSGSGKSFIAEHFTQLVAFTTRSRRENEQEGVEYFFKDKDFIEQEIEKYEKGESDYIVEWGKYGDNYYGTLKEEFEKAMKENDVVVNIMEMSGALKMKKKYGDLVKLVWVDVKENIRVERLKRRLELTGESLEEFKERTREEHRDNEKDLCDYVIFNSSTIESSICQLREYIELLKNDSVSSIIENINILKQMLPDQNSALNYYELTLRYNLYSGLSSKLKNDIEYLEELKWEQIDPKIENLINEIIEYMNSIYIMGILEK